MTVRDGPTSTSALEWRRLAEMPEPARSSPHRPYWACARFLVCMHSLATCSRLTKPCREREAGVWCSEVVGLGAKVAEKRGPRHSEVFNLAYDYDEFGETFDAGLLVGLRDELVIEERDRWDMLTEREQDVLLQVDAAGEAGLQSGQLAKQLSHHAQEEVAKKLGCTQTWVSNSELGERRVDFVELEDFAALYDKVVGVVQWFGTRR